MNTVTDAIVLAGLQAPEPERALASTGHVDRVARTLDASLSANTRHSYETALRGLQVFAAQNNAAWFDPVTLTTYLAWLPERTDETGRVISCSKSMIGTLLAAVRQYALENNLPSPTDDATVRRAAAGARKLVARHTVVKAHALNTDELRTILTAIDQTTPIGKRDAAMLVLMFSAALRRSEVAQLRVGDLEVGQDGIKVGIAVSKTDQFGSGALVGVVRGKHPETDPVALLGEWLNERAKFTRLRDDTPVFVRVMKGGRLAGTQPLTGNSVGEILKARAKNAGVTAPNISGHSARRGHITVAANAGADLHTLAKTSRHMDLGTLLGYIQAARVLDTTTSKVLGL